MCLAIPAQIDSLDGEFAVAHVGGIRRRINISLVSGLQPGDFVVVHVGYALNRLDPDEAERTLALLREAHRIETEVRAV